MALSPSQCDGLVIKLYFEPIGLKLISTTFSTTKDLFFILYCYDLASSLRKRNDAQGKGWLDFNSLSLTNGLAWADSEDNVSGVRTGGSKG